jgi:hypothetical protein
VKIRVLQVPRHSTPPQVPETRGCVSPNKMPLPTVVRRDETVPGRKPCPLV